MRQYNILLLNNTENYHSGCKTVINFYRKHFADHNLTIADNLDVDVKKYDLVIANGEGTMHHNSEKANKILDLLIQADKSMLVNTVWQNNDKKIAEKLLDISYVSVREIKSKDEIYQQIGLTADIHLDYSWFVPVEFTTKEYKNLVAGNKMNVPNVKPKKPKIKDIGEDGYIDIFKQSWNDIVSQLKNSKVLVTGRHHEMYAACKAGCPFIVIEGNTHKNQGLFETAKVNIPILPFNCSNEEIIKAVNNINQYQSEYKKLFDYMARQQPPELLKYVGMV
jgi:polysaccharide pyruvyl transferase WcaK-like protein